MSDDLLREHLVQVLTWQDAHVGFDRVVEGLPVALRGAVPDALPYSPWQLVEHLRLAQADILSFCRDHEYTELRWPDDYWPEAPTPPGAKAWEKSLAGFRSDLAALVSLARDRGTDLFAPVPHGTGQTYLREFLLVADHNAYHVGQLVTVRRALGAWS